MLIRCCASFTAVLVSAIQLHWAHTRWSYLCACVWHNQRIPSLTAAKSVYPQGFTVEYKPGTCIQHAYDHRPVSVLVPLAACLHLHVSISVCDWKREKATASSVTVRKQLRVFSFQRMRGRDQWCLVHARYEAGVRVTGRHGAQTILNRNLFGQLQLF